MKRALVTGAAGFVGRHVVESLRRRGWRVIAARRKDADLTDPEAARRLIARARPQVIVHAVGTTKGDWKALWQAHVRATANVLDAVAALEASRRPRVVIAGSSAEYGAAAGRAPVRENLSVAPLTPYGASKFSQTLLALAYAGRGVDVVVARIFNTCGPGSPANMVPGAFARQIAEIERGERPPVITVGNLASSRDFLDMRDAAAAVARLADSRIPAGVYNVCSGASTRIGDALKILLAESKRKIAVRAAASASKSADVPYIAGDRSKFARATGWKPAIPLERSLRETLDWCRANPC